MTRPRILHLIHKVDIGGAERQLLTSLKAFDPERFEHRVGLLFRRGELYPEIEALGLPTVEFHLRTRSLPFAIKRLVEYLRREQVDVVHAHLHLIAIYARIAARIAGTPACVYTEHSDVGRRPLHWRLVERSLVPWTSYKLTVSEIQRQLTIEREGFPPDRVEWIANSVRVDDFAADPRARVAIREELGIPSDAQVIGNISNMRKLKRLDVLIDAFARLAPQRPMLWLLLVGDGADRADLLARAATSGVGDRIVMPGPRLDVAALLQAMDLFAISSHSEGLPINLLEAMAARLPALATRVGAIPDVLTHERSGLLVDAGDDEAFGRELEKLVDDSDLRARLIETGYAHVRSHYDASVNARRLEEIYASLLDHLAGSARTAHQQDAHAERVV